MNRKSSQGNRQPERELIIKFREILFQNEYLDKSVRSHFGDNRANIADIEFLSRNGEYLVLEAKSHNSGDAYNTFHKVFGELLKECGKKNAEREHYLDVLKLGILIPEDLGTRGKEGIYFYRNHFRDIPPQIFTGFGLLVGAKYIFVCSEKKERVSIYTWEGFYNGEEPVEQMGAVEKKE